MIVKILKDTTITVKAGQTVDVDDESASYALKLGFVETVTQDEQPKPVKKTVKKAAK
jgi:hypothetical protein